jgi:hypothetical protein
MVENDPVTRQLIHVRCLHARSRVATHGIRALIVGQQENDVRSFRRAKDAQQERLDQQGRSESNTCHRIPKS